MSGIGTLAARSESAAAEQTRYLGTALYEQRHVLQLTFSTPAGLRIDNAVTARLIWQALQTHTVSLHATGDDAHINEVYRASNFRRPVSAGNSQVITNSALAGWALEGVSVLCKGGADLWGDLAGGDAPIGSAYKQPIAKDVVLAIPVPPAHRAACSGC